jgi:hypothetical protein
MSLLRVLSVLGIAVVAVPTVAQPTAPRTDVFGDPLPSAAVARLGTVRLRHAAAVQDVRFLAGGKWLLSGGSDDTVRLWDPLTGRELHHFPGQTGRLAPDGKTLVTWGRGCHVWDLATAKELPWSRAQLQDLGSNPSAAFTADGKALVVAALVTAAGMDEGKLKVQTFDLATGKLRSAWLGPRWNGDMGQHFLAAGDIIGVHFGRGWDPSHHIDLHDAATGKVVGRGPFFSMIFPSADGSRFATEEVQPEDSKERIHLVVLDSKTGKELYRFPTRVETNAALRDSLQNL